MRVRIRHPLHYLNINGGARIGLTDCYRFGRGFDSHHLHLRDTDILYLLGYLCVLLWSEVLYSPQKNTRSSIEPPNKKIPKCCVVIHAISVSFHSCIQILKQGKDERIS